MTPENIFLDTLEDLRIRCHLRASEYDMVQASGLMRRLLMDSAPLWSRANRTWRLKVTVEWSRTRVAYKTDSGRGYWIPALWLDPMLGELKEFTSPTLVVEGPDRTLVPAAPDATPLKLVLRTGNLQAFLRYEAIRPGSVRDETPHDNGPITVGQLIKHYANREGGVHYDESPADESTIEDIRLTSDEPLRHTILSAGRIVCRAMEPLAAALLLADRPWPTGLAPMPAKNP